MAKYYANFAVNNGTSLIRDEVFSNKREACKYILSRAKGECFYGSRGHCYVTDSEGNVVFSRATWDGRRWFNNEEA